MSLFIPITKIDEERRIVYGLAADETPDRQKEIWDYEGNKPYWQKWSEAAAKTTEAAGQAVSYGNVRSMHPLTRQMIASGRLDCIEFDDAKKSMEVGAKIVDELDWQKVVEGVYTGFSVGGKYVKKWADKVFQGIQRVIIDPTELSLVDLPANPNAMFTAIKMGGQTEMRAFKVVAREDVKPEEGKNKYGDVEFADAENKKYPIVAAWKKKIDKAGPPSAAKVFSDNARKGMYTLGIFSQIIQQLADLSRGLEMERDMEGDDSDAPERMAKLAADASDLFLEIADEEITELIEGLTLPTGTEGE